MNEPRSEETVRNDTTIYTAESVRAEITPEFRDACVKSFRRSEEVGGYTELFGDQLLDVWVAGCWYKEKLRAFGVDEWSREKMEFNFGRACLFREPYETAAKAISAFVSKLPPTGRVANNERIYDEQIAPLMTQIIAICKEHGLPMVAAFQYVEDGACITALLNTPGAHLGFVAASRILFNRSELPADPRRSTDGDAK